jgi:hypothetical protein
VSKMVENELSEHSEVLLSTFSWAVVCVFGWVGFFGDEAAVG